METTPYEARFWSKVHRQPNGCWEWTASRLPRGYGRFSLGGKQVGAHRVSWELHHGAIPSGLAVLHRCDNPPCVRPDHLFLGTLVDNIRDMIRKGRDRKARGIGNGRAKLTDEEVAAIRSEVSGGRSQVSVARAFGVSSGHVSRLCRDLRRAP